MEELKNFGVLRKFKPSCVAIKGQSIGSKFKNHETALRTFFKNTEVK